MTTIERTPRPEKVAVVSDVESRLADSVAAILTEYRGIPVTRLESLRRALRGAGGEYKIYKNTLVRRAVAAQGVEGLDELLTGPTGIAFVSGDVSTVAKVLRDFAVENPALVVKGGLIGRDLIDARGATALADLPSREVLLSQLAGMFAAPMQRFASLLKAIPQNLAYGISALIDARPEGAPSDQATASAGSEQSAVESDPSASEPAPIGSLETASTESPSTESGSTESASADAETASNAGAEAEATAPEPSEPTSGE